MPIIIDGTTGITTPGETNTGNLSVAGTTTLTTPLPVASGGTGASSLSSITTGTATNLAGGSNGTIPYQSAAGTTQMLAVGTAGQVLQTNGAGAPSWVTPGGGSWVYLSTVTASSSATVDITTTINSTYDTYFIIASNVVASSNNESLYARFYMSGDYQEDGYRVALTYNNDQQTTYERITATAQNKIRVGIDLSNNAARTYEFVMRISQPSLTTTNKTVYIQGSSIQEGGFAQWIQGTGANTNYTSAVSRIRFLMGSGNITSGVFRLYGVKNS